MKNKQILIIVIILIVLLTIIILTNKNRRENFKAPSTCSSSTTVEPNSIQIIPGQPLMFRAFADKGNVDPNINYLHQDPSICSWFQAGSIINVNYSTFVVCQGEVDNQNLGLIYFPLLVNFISLPNFTSATKVIGQGVYTMIGYGIMSLFTESNYQHLENGTVMVNTTASPPVVNVVNLSCVQHYPGAKHWPADHGGNDWYTYNITIQFSYNI
jgi:hypothetical protein